MIKAQGSTKLQRFISVIQFTIGKTTTSSQKEENSALWRWKEKEKLFSYGYFVLLILN